MREKESYFAKVHCLDDGYSDVAFDVCCCHVVNGDGLENGRFDFGFVASCNFGVNEDYRDDALFLVLVSVVFMLWMMELKRD